MWRKVVPATIKMLYQQTHTARFIQCRYSIHYPIYIIMVHGGPKNDTEIHFGPSLKKISKFLPVSFFGPPCNLVKSILKKLKNVSGYSLTVS